jgi:hypothetical protein
MYENGTMKPDETVLRRGRKRINKKNGEVNLTKIYCKHFVNVTMCPWYNYNMLIIKKNYSSIL